ncbi:MAG TPA: hypothetical protein VIR27_13060 [Mycobacteriales bacterium]
MTRLRVVRLVGAALVAASTVLAFSATAGANPGHDKPAPDSGDSRAISYAGNATTCADIGLGGATPYDDDYLQGSGYAALNNDKTKVTISGLPDGVTLTAIVVKGGDGYNLYTPGERGLGESLPYTDLHSPLVGQGNIPTISHWFACGTQTTPVTCDDGSQPGDDGLCEDGTEPTCEDGSQPAEDGSCDSGTSPTAPATTTPAGQVDAATPAVSGSDTKSLANTGFNPVMPTILAIMLLLVGGLMVITPARAIAMVSRLRRR